MAKLGAHVTGVDISPGSIVVSERRALLDGVADRTRFLCAPLEDVALADHAFDVIWGDGVLHHLIPVLGDVMARLLRWAAPGALFLFSEPVSVSRLMRRLRAGMPIHTDATPDERPLREAELEIVERALPGLRKEWFGVFARFGRYVVRQNDFEHSPRPNRLALDALWLADRALLSVPGLAHFGSTCILQARAPVS
jgi:SAM-dependent methyltransferase